MTRRTNKLLTRIMDKIGYHTIKSIHRSGTPNYPVEYVYQIGFPPHSNMDVDFTKTNTPDEIMIKLSQDDMGSSLKIAITDIPQLTERLLIIYNTYQEEMNK